MLIALLWITVVVTLGCWCIPLLFLPRPILRKLHLPVNEPILFVRLLGSSCLALSVLYFLGALRAHQGRDVSDVVICGLVGNGMSAALIWRYALQGYYRHWPRVTQAYVYTSGGLVTALALALLVVGLWYD